MRHINIYMHIYRYIQTQIHKHAHSYRCTKELNSQSKMVNTVKTKGGRNM